MPLADIRQFLVARGAADNVATINLAAKELYNSTDIPEILETCYVSLDEREARFALPWFIASFRAAKRQTDKLPVVLNTPMPEFNYSEFFQQPLTWRILGRSPLFKDIANGGPLTFTRAVGDTVDVTLAITGETDLSVRQTESLAFPVSQTSVTSSGSYNDLAAIRKSVLTNADIRVTNVAGEEVGFIPGRLYEVNHVIIQPYDMCMTQYECACYKILYKPILWPLEADTDFFPHPQFEDAVCWLALSIDALTKQPELAETYANKARTIYSNFTSNLRSGVEKTRRQSRPAIYNKLYSGKL